MKEELPVGWEWKRLGEVCDKPQYGYTTSASKNKSGPLFVRTTDITNGTIDWNAVPYCDVPPQDNEKYLLQDGDILISRAGSVGASIVVKNPTNAVFASYLIRFKPNDSIISDYLGYFLKSQYFSMQLESSSSGTTLKGINATNLAKIEVPLPPLDVQQKIVSILEKAEETKRLRAQADELTQQLLENVFLEMFGDPRTNPHRWEFRKIKTISEKFSDGPFGSNLKSEHYKSNGIRVIRLQNIGVSNFIDDDKAFISEEHFSTLKRHTCFPRDVIIGTMGSPNLRACMLPDSIPIALNKADCIQCRPHENIAVGEYICHLLNLPSTLQMASNMIHGQTRSRISMGNLSMLEIPIPPLELQRKYAAIVQKLNITQQYQQQSSQELDFLFNALMQKAFTGELMS